MTNPIRIAAVVVTFNRLRQLQTTLQKSLQAGVDWLVVVNNASTDGTCEWLDDQTDSRLIVLNLPTNLGGAGGFHHGFEHVVKHLSADWLVCYDDDAYPEIDSLAVFRQMDIPPTVAGVAASVYLPDGRISEMNRPSRDPFESLRSLLRTIFKRRSGFHVSDDDYAQRGLIPIDFSSFVGCFLRTDAIRQHLGLPRSELFIYA
jgi:rhamnopyranosyl-N-acetylglucosaminyl-diphospho-decaprenol beta-1,3/1,4-galactofuranosyltransferase